LYKIRCVVLDVSAYYPSLTTIYLLFISVCLSVCCFFVLLIFFSCFFRRLTQYDLVVHLDADTYIANVRTCHAMPCRPFLRPSIPQREGSLICLHSFPSVSPSLLSLPPPFPLPVAHHRAVRQELLPHLQHRPQHGVLQGKTSEDSCCTGSTCSGRSSSRSYGSSSSGCLSVTLLPPAAALNLCANSYLTLFLYKKFSIFYCTICDIIITL
jgi:hypothetical protein